MFVECVRMAGTGLVTAVQVGPCAHTTLPLGLPGLVNPWVASRVAERGGKEEGWEEGECPIRGYTCAKSWESNYKKRLSWRRYEPMVFRMGRGRRYCPTGGLGGCV